MNRLAPIVLFVYNRPWHTEQTLIALSKNDLANQSILYIYSDGSKTNSTKEEVEKIDEVRKLIRTKQWCKEVHVIEREKNWGLADSIVDGVTEIVNRYGKIIVLEDDLVTSPYFLKFMNEALEFYENEERVWHVSGWNYPMETDGLDDVFLWRLMNCWGWATWADRWKYYEKDVDKTINEFTKEDIKRFDIDGAENFFRQVVSNHEKKINTWAIFWYATIFKKDGLCLNPSQSFVKNIGNDSSGTHCGSTDIFKGNISLLQQIKFNQNITENKIAIENLKLFYKNSKKSILERIINKIKRLIKWK